MTSKRHVGLGALTLASGLLLGGYSMSADAGELVYRPLNPSFGGDPFRGGHLLNKAQIQDTHTDPSARTTRPQPLSATQRLVQSLQSRLVSQLIGDVATGELSEGGFESDEFSVFVTDIDGQLSVQITDKLTGDVTTISVGGLFNP